VFCPECAGLWGVLNYYPAIKETLDIRAVGISHPRDPICELLGEGQWNGPTLILADPDADPGIAGAQTSKGYVHLGSARNIAKYFAEKFGTAVPRGS